MRRSYLVSLIAVVAVAAASLVGVLAAGWAPVLGVQLQGGVEVVLRPTEDVTDEQLDRAIEIIRDRVDALGVAEPDITRQGQQVVIQLPGVKDRQRAVDLVGQTAELRFRPVLVPFDANDPQSRADAAALFDAFNSTADPTAAPTGDEDAAGDGDPEVTAEPLFDNGDTDVADDGESTSTSTTTSTPTTTTLADDAEPPVENEGDAQADEPAPTTSVPAPTTTVFDPATAPTLEELLTAPEDDVAESAVILAEAERDDGNRIGYLLAPAELTGEVVSDANATFQGSWVVLVDFNSEGSDAFDALAAANLGRQVAIVLDGIVESAPTINAAEFDGTAVISGQFTEGEAEDLALVLRFGALPVEFEQDDVRTVSATLGEGTLQAGVAAGLVGLILVGIYMIFYYRMLGIVAVSSLAVSGAILWSFIAYLGESQGLALTLAGATGIVVSIGVQVDSNIVYYERIKEEVKRGRAVRSAADGSFSAAFRTIVWADLASLIGAFVLYYLTSGTVRGFALFLGITTLIDIFVSYFFMRPLVVLIARRLVGENPSRLGMSDTTAEVAS